MSAEIQIMLLYLAIALVFYIGILAAYVEDMSESEEIVNSAVLAIFWPVTVLLALVIIPLRAIAYTVILMKDKIING